MSLVLFDSHKKYYVIQDQVPMRRNGTPGSEEDMEAFYDRWLPLVAKEFYRLNGVKKSDQVNSKLPRKKLDINLCLSFRLDPNQSWLHHCLLQETGTLWKS